MICWGICCSQSHQRYSGTAPHTIHCSHQALHRRARTGLNRSYHVRDIRDVTQRQRQQKQRQRQRQQKKINVLHHPPMPHILSKYKKRRLRERGYRCNTRVDRAHGGLAGRGAGVLWLLASNRLSSSSYTRTHTEPWASSSYSFEPMSNDLVEFGIYFDTCFIKEYSTSIFGLVHQGPSRTNKIQGTLLLYQRVETVLETSSNLNNSTTYCPGAPLRTTRRMVSDLLRNSPPFS